MDTPDAKIMFFVHDALRGIWLTVGGRLWYFGKLGNGHLADDLCAATWAALGRLEEGKRSGRPPTGCSRPAQAWLAPAKIHKK